MVYCHVSKIVLVFDCADAEAKVNAVTESQAVAVALVASSLPLPHVPQQNVCLQGNGRHMSQTPL